MKSEWKRVRIADVADVRRGASPRPIHNFLSDEGMPWVKIADATSKNSRYIAKTKEFIKESGVSASVVVVPETLILSNSATPGLPRIMKIQACVHDGWLVFGNYRNVERDFLYYLLTYVRPNLIGLANGSVFQNLKTDIVNQFEISLPPLSYQRKVAAILSSLDDKIENNSAICKNLEEQMSLCYESLSRERNCKEQLIGNVAEKVAMGPFGSNIKVSTFVSSGVPVISGAHLHGKIMQGENFNYITAEHASKLKNALVHADDIVLTHAGTLGQASIVPPNTGYNEYMISQRQFFLRCDKKKIYPLYALLFLHSQNGQRQLLSYANQTGVPSIAQPTTNLKKLSISVPPIDVQRQWYEQVKPLYVMNLIIMQENRRLTSLRNALLPKLISGKIDVDKAAVPLS